MDSQTPGASTLQAQQSWRERLPAAGCIASLTVGASLVMPPLVAEATIALDFELQVSEAGTNSQANAVRPMRPKIAVEKMPTKKTPALFLSFVPPQASSSSPVLVTEQGRWRPSLLSRSPFKGGTQSLVARAVGHAEGTRTVTGAPTWAYWGHVDPGNQAWNQGTFSYQHGAASPEEADAKQLQRLARQAKELARQAKEQGIKLSLLEQLNGIDLANQAPLAALDRGYIDRLAEAKQMDLSEAEAILWARTWSYWDPDLNHWNAPGLGNTRSSIEADQQRRQWAIAQVLGQS